MNCLRHIIYQSFRIFVGIVLFSIITMCKSPQAVFEPGNHWADTDGNHINAHGGGILYHKGRYYWYGEHKSDHTSSAQVGITCYSSKDLRDWKYEGVVLPVSNDEDSDIAKGCVMERPKVIYNKENKQFVMWFHLELKGKGYAAARSAVAVSDSPVGTFQYRHALRPNAKQWPLNLPEKYRYTTPDTTSLKWWTTPWYEAISQGLFVRRDWEGGQMARDMTLFVDDDAKAYHIYSSEDNLTLHIAELTDNYLNHTGNYIRIAPAGHNEAPAIFKKDGIYWMITSGCTGWEPNAARLLYADAMMGEWKQLPNPAKGKGADLTFRSQSTYVLPVQGKKNAFIYMGDRWTPKKPSDASYIWLPIQFDEQGTPYFEWFDKWDTSFFNK